MTTNMQQLYQRMDKALNDEPFASDVSRAAAIGMDLCGALPNLPDEQLRNALDVARKYWRGEANEETRLLHVDGVARRSDGERQSGVGPHERAMTGLVWWALGANMGLTWQAGERLVELGENAGLTADQMEQIFLRHIPGF